MANFPEILDDFTPKVNDTTDVMAADVNGLQTAVASLQTKVGVDSSAVSTSHDYKIAQLESTRELTANKENTTINTSTTKYPTVNLLKTVKDIADAKMSNPMSATGDIIYGGASGVATRLAKGDDDKVLMLKSGLPSWETPASGGADIIEVQMFS